MREIKFDFEQDPMLVIFHIKKKSKEAEVYFRNYLREDKFDSMERKLNKVARYYREPVFESVYQVTIKKISKFDFNENLSKQKVKEEIDKFFDDALKKETKLDFEEDPIGVIRAIKQGSRAAEECFAKYHLQDEIFNRLKNKHLLTLFKDEKERQNRAQIIFNKTWESSNNKFKEGERKNDFFYGRSKNPESVVKAVFNYFYTSFLNQSRDIKRKRNQQDEFIAPINENTEKQVNEWTIDKIPSLKAYVLEKLEELGTPCKEVVLYRFNHCLDAGQPWNCLENILKEILPKEIYTKIKESKRKDFKKWFWSCLRLIYGSLTIGGSSVSQHVLDEYKEAVYIALEQLCQEDMAAAFFFINIKEERKYMLERIELANKNDSFTEVQKSNFKHTQEEMYSNKSLRCEGKLNEFIHRHIFNLKNK